MPQPDFSTNMTVYPNPVTNSDFTIDYIARDATKVSFILYNPQGSVVFGKEVDGKGCYTN